MCHGLKYLCVQYSSKNIPVFQVDQLDPQILSFQVLQAVPVVLLAPVIISLFSLSFVYSNIIFTINIKKCDVAGTFYSIAAIAGT